MALSALSGDEDLAGDHVGAPQIYATWLGAKIIVGAGVFHGIVSKRTKGGAFPIKNIAVAGFLAEAFDDAKKAKVAWTGAVSKMKEWLHDEDIVDLSNLILAAKPQV